MQICLSKQEVAALTGVCSRVKDIALSNVRIEIYGDAFARLTACDTFRLVTMEQGDRAAIQGTEPTTKYITPQLFKALLEKRGVGRQSYFRLNTEHIGDLEGRQYPNIERVMPERGDNTILIQAGAVTFAAPYGVDVLFLADAAALIPEETPTWFAVVEQDPEKPLYAEFNTQFCAVRYVISPCMVIMNEMKGEVREAKSLYISRKKIEGVK